MRVAKQNYTLFKGGRMKLKDDDLALKGELFIKIYKKDKLIDIWKDENLIVNGAKTILAALVSGDGAGTVISKIGFGISNTPANPDDTALTSSYVRNLTGFTYPEAGKVSFNFELSTNEANGITIKEFGLITSDNILFSRKVRGGIEKNDDISLEGTWTLTF